MLLSKNDIYFGDSIELLSKIETQTIDACITDPPFGCRFDRTNSYSRKKDRVIDEYIEVPQNKYEEFSQQWIQEVHRCLKSNGSIHVFSGYQNLEFILKALRLSGFHILNHLVWHYNFGQNTKYSYVPSHYTIIYAVKNEKDYYFNQYARFTKSDLNKNGKKLHYKDRETVWYKTKERWDKYWTTKTRLPQEIIKKILLYTTKKNDLICDPFCGSGQIPITCKELSRNFISFEKSKAAYNFAKHRLETNRYSILHTEEIPDYT